MCESYLCLKCGSVGATVWNHGVCFSLTAKSCEENFNFLLIFWVRLVAWTTLGKALSQKYAKLSLINSRLDISNWFKEIKFFFSPQDNNVTVAKPMKETTYEQKRRKTGRKKFGLVHPNRKFIKTPSKDFFFLFLRTSIGQFYRWMHKIMVNRWWKTFHLCCLDRKWQQRLRLAAKSTTSPKIQIYIFFFISLGCSIKMKNISNMIFSQIIHHFLLLHNHPIVAFVLRTQTVLLFPLIHFNGHLFARLSAWQTCLSVTQKKKILFFLLLRAC